MTTLFPSKMTKLSNVKKWAFIWGLKGMTFAA